MGPRHPPTGPGRAAGAPNEAAPASPPPDRTSDGDGQPSSTPTGRRFRQRLWTVVGALGLASSVGGILVQSSYQSAQDRLLDPVTVSIENRTSAPNYVFPATAEPRAAPVDMDTIEFGEFQRWARQNGGLPYQDRSFEMVLRGRTAKPVLIDDIRARAVGRQAIPSDAWVNSWEGCGAVVPVRLLEIDLSQEPPGTDVYIDEELVDSPVLRVSESDVEVFEVDVFGAEDVTSWVLEISYSADGRDGTLRIDEVDGEPLRLAGGGDPLVFSPIPGVTGLFRDDAVRDGLRRGDPLC